MVEGHGIPFHYVPAPKTEKEDAFSTTKPTIDRHDADTIVISRGLRYHLDKRVLVHGNKAVVFT